MITLDLKDINRLVNHKWAGDVIINGNYVYAELEDMDGNMSAIEAEIDDSGGITNMIYDNERLHQDDVDDFMNYLAELEEAILFVIANSQKAANDN